MTNFGHIPVLLSEAVALLAPKAGGVYADGTLGGGGHTGEILRRCDPNGRVLGIDRDEQALHAAREQLAWAKDRVTYAHAEFGALKQVLADRGVPAVDGILVDLGLSSWQLARAERGFSFSSSGPIDMRMDTSQGESASQLIRRLTVHELQKVLSEFGEERYSARVARRIKEAMDANALTDTHELANVIVRAIPAASRRRERIHPATRTFQALRIAVNEELAELDRLLQDFPDLLNPGGRLVVIAYHSLEDRRVKNRLRQLAWTSSLPDDLAQAAGEPTQPICVPLTKKPIVPGDDEVLKNPRSRSAKLRACEKVAR